MSKAFTSEETPETPPVVPRRAPLPAGVPNYVTERGLAHLRAELDGIRQEVAGLNAQADDPGGAAEAATRTQELVALAARRSELEGRIATAEVVPLPDPGDATVRFGAQVTVEGRDGRRCYRIVGVDEADATHGRIAFVSPVARALLGRAVGDVVRVRLPRGEEELEIAEVGYTTERVD